VDKELISLKLKHLEFYLPCGNLLKSPPKISEIFEDENINIFSTKDSQMGL
jgi:hypothetical protein